MIKKARNAKWVKKEKIQNLESIMTKKDKI